MLNYLVYLFLLLALLFDLLFYIPIHIHFYIDKENFYLYFFSIAIIKINKKEKVNKLKNKIEINTIINTKKEDLKIIESFKIDKIYLRISNKIANNYSYFFYPLIYLNNYIEEINYKINDNNVFYIKVKINISNILVKLLQIRRLKHERTSN